MASKLNQPYNYKVVLGQSWDTVDLPETPDEDELRQGRADFERRFGIESQPLPDAADETQEPTGIPIEFMCLFGSYPMEDGFSVALCKFCGTRVKTQYMDIHTSECDDIPDEEREILDEYDEDIGSLVEVTDSSIPGLSKIKIHRHGHVPVPKALPVAKVPTPTTLATTTTATTTTKPSAKPQSPSTSTSSKLKPPVLQSEKDVKDVKPVIEKSNTPSTAAIMKSKLSSQGISTTAAELKPQSPSSAELLKPKPKIVATEMKGPSSPSSSMMPKLKPSLILKISANTSPANSPGNVDGQVQSGVKAKTYSVSHSSVSAAGSEFDSLQEPPSPTLLTSPGAALTPPATPVPTKASLKSMDVVDRDAPAKKKKKKKSKNEPRKVIPLKERSFNPNEHCGVANADGSQCKRSLTCKTHSMALRRAVPSRSHPFDMLLASHKKARDEAKLAKQGEDLLTVKEILNSNVRSQERTEPPSTEAPFLDSASSVVNSTDSSRGRTILTSLLANCSPTNINKSRPHVVSPRQSKEQQSLHKTSFESKKKNKSFKYKKDDTDTIGLDLYQLDTEPGFVCFDDILPPDDEVENCDVVALDSLYNSIVPLRETLDSDDESDLLPFPLVPIMLGRRKKRHQSPRQLVPVNNFPEIPAMGALKCESEFGIDANITISQAYYKPMDSECNSSGRKRMLSSGSSDQFYTSNKRNNQGQLSNYSEIYEQPSELQSTKHLYQLDGKGKAHGFSRQNGTAFHHSLVPDQISAIGQDGNSIELRSENSSKTLTGMIAHSPASKISFKIKGKQSVRPCKSPITGPAMESRSHISNPNNPGIKVSQSYNDGVPMIRVRDGSAASSTRIPGELNHFPPQTLPTKLQPDTHQYDETPAKAPEPPVARTPMKMPSLVSSQKTIITFNMGGTIAQVMSHNPGVHYHGSDDVRDQNTTWASLLEQVRAGIGIEQARTEDAPVADSELSKLLAAQFEDC